MHICVLTSHYPSINDPTFAFVETLVCSLVDLGHCCTVISPQSRLSAIKNKRVIRKKVETRRTKLGNEYILYSPRIMSVSKIPIISGSIMHFLRLRYTNSVEHVIGSLNPKPDVLYGHFANPSGMLASKLGYMYGIPSFVAFGESQLKSTLNGVGMDKVAKDLIHLSGALAVSTQLKNEVLSLNILPDIPIKVIPNAVDDSLFYPRPEDTRNSRRRELGIGEDDFVAAFVGYFNERKGSNRLLEAIKDLEGVKGLFFGSGPLLPVGDQVAFCGSVDHQRLPEYLCCADVFVLPTLAEGCCNAIIEAMACGLPIISSDCSFNDDILFDDNSIRVDPSNVSAIRQAILELKDKCEIRKEMGMNSLLHAREFTIINRAAKIIQFINKCIEDSDL